MILAAFALVLLAAFLAGASEYSGAGGFFKQWAGWAIVVAGLGALGVFVGWIMRNALCASLWVCN